MALAIFEYNPDKNKPEVKGRAVDIESLRNTLSELEEYSGLTQEKVYEIYYELKRQLKDAAESELEVKK